VTPVNRIYPRLCYKPYNRSFTQTLQIKTTARSYI